LRVEGTQAHHSLLLHGARSNVSASRGRRALGAVFFAQRCEEDTLAKEEYQRQLNAKLAAEKKI
jgi:hypothetical protein